MKILLIGFGNIGYHHASGLLASNKIKKIDIIENNETNYLKNIKKLSNLKKNYLSNISRFNINNFSTGYNFAIVSTDANSRLLVLKKIITKKIKTILIEKIPFNSLREIKNFNNILIKKNYKIYVNLPRRTYSSYNFIKKKLDSNDFKINKIEIFGVTGLLSNTIHFIDLIMFLFDCKLMSLNSVIEEIYKTKRKDYLDFHGKFECTFLKNNYDFCVNIFSKKKNTFKNDITIKIFTSNSVIYIKEDYEKLKVSLKIKKKINKYPILYQSKLSKKIVDNFNILLHYPTWSEISKINNFILESTHNTGLYDSKIKRILTT